VGRNRIQAVVDLEDRLSGKLAKVARSVRGFRQETDASARSTSKWGGQLDKMATKVHNFFGAKTKSLVRGWFMSMKVSAAIGMAGVSIAIGKAFKDYVAFESTLRNTTGLLAGGGMGTKGVEKAFDQFRQDIYRLAPKLAKTPQQLAETLYDIVSGGFSGADATMVLEAATKGASAGNTDPAVVGNALVKTLSAYGYGAKEATRITDQMFQSVNLGIISFEEMAQQIGDVVGLAATAKVPFEDLMAAIAVMTRKGLVPAEAFTSLNQMMLSVLSPGQAEKEAASAIFGADVESMWSAQAMAAKGISGVMDGLMSKLDPSPDQIKRMNSMNAEVADLATAEVAGDKLDVLTSLFGNVRALRGALVLASKEGYTFADAQERAGKAAGATGKVLEQQRKTVKFQLDQLKSYANVFSLEVMQDIAPAIGEKTKEISNFFREVMDSADYRNAKGMGKITVLGKAVWEEVSGWWEKNKAAVSKKVSDGIDWLGGTVVPLVADIGFQIGQALVPAIWKGLMNTTPGRMLVAGVALSWGNKLGGGIASQIAQGAAGGAAGGASGQAAGGSLLGPGGTLRMAAGTAIAVTGAVMAVNELRMTYNREVKRVDEAAAQTATNLQTMTPTQLTEAEKRANAGKWEAKDYLTIGLTAALDKEKRNWAAAQIYSMLPGRKSPGELVAAEKNRDLQRTTANTIASYEQNGLLPALEKLWYSPNNELLKTVLKGNDAKTWTDQNNLTASAFRTGEVAKMGDFSSTIRQYSEDPTKLSAAQRTAVEFLIANTKDTVGNITDSADALYNQGYSQETFSRALEIANPILEDVGLKTMEWAVMLTAAKKALDDANAYLASAPTGAAFTNPFGLNRPLNPDQTRPSGTGPGWGMGAASTNPTGASPTDRLPAFAPPRKPTVPPTRVQKNALGSRGIVRKPTLFLAGESGDEDFSFTPHFKGGVDGGGSGKREVNINAPLVGQVLVDPNGKSTAEIADELATMVLDHLENGA